MSTTNPYGKGCLPNDLATILKAFESCRDGLLGIAAESPYNGYWYVDELA